MKIVAYYRVSTQKQGQSGLGLQAQKQSVEQYASKAGAVIVASFTDIQSGKSLQRKGLLQAVQACKQSQAVLVVAKLDRLSREGFGVLSLLEQQGVTYLEAESPNDSELVRSIKFAIAKEEREKISKRTKQALQAKKAQGFILGNPQNFSQQGRLKSAKIRVQQAKENPINKQAFLVIEALQAQGLSKRAIAGKLNESGFVTVTGKPFTAMQVSRIQKHYA